MTSHIKSRSWSEEISNRAEYPVLGVLLLCGPIHGYEMCHLLEEGIGLVWRLRKSQIYGLLARLERKGLVSHERVGQDNLPAKNIFSITTEGREVFQEWLNQPINHIRDIRTEFLAKFWFFGKVFPDGKRLLIERQLGVCRTKSQALEKLKDSCVNPIEALSIDFRLTIVRATVSWLEGLLGSLETAKSREKKESINA